MRLDLNLPVMAATLLAAAVAQDLAPLYPGAPVKPAFLTAVGLYYALTRPVLPALTALVWAGALTDALGGLPLACTLSFLVAAYGAVRLMRRVFLEPTLAQGTLLVAAAAVAQALWTRAWVGGDGPLLAWRTLAGVGAAAPAGLIAGFFGFLIGGLADRCSGLVKPAREEHGLWWAQANR